MTLSPGPTAEARWLDRFFAHWRRSNPVGATFAGEHSQDGYLPDYSRAGVEEAKSRIESLLAESSTLAVESLDLDGRHDIRLAQGALRIQQWELQSRHFHRGNPSLYTGELAFGLISPLLTEYAPLEPRARAVGERLAAAPGFLEQARSNLEGAPASWTARAIHECDGLLALLNEGLPAFADGRLLGDALLARAVAGARTAVEEFRAFLEGDLTRRPVDDVAAGPDALDLHLSEGHCLRESASEIERYARAELAEVSAEVAERAGDFGAASPGEALDQLKQLHPSEAEYTGSYQRVWEEARRLSEAEGLLTWPEAPIRYLERPAWVRKAAANLYFLFYRSPAPRGGPAVHEYLIAPLDRTASEAERRLFLESHNDSVIKLNHVIHHGGIGHHVQNARASQSGSRVGRMAAVDCASRIALLCGGTMAEGWACYATDLMAEAGFLTPLEEYAERQGRARMCARAIADVRIHQGRWTLEQAARFYEEHALMPAAAARAEAVKNSMFPGAAVMYLMGRDAIHRLRADLIAIEGRHFSRKRFHDDLLSHGSIPVSLIATAMKQAAVASSSSGSPAS